MPIENRMITDYRAARIAPNVVVGPRSVSVPARSDNPLTKDRCLPVKLRQTHASRLFASTRARSPTSTGAIITPIFQTSTYVQDEVGRHKGFRYARTQNPTRAALEQNIAAIESGRGAFAFASGMAAIGAIASMLKSGDHVVVTDNTYGGTFRLFDKVLTRYGLSFSYVDTSSLALIEQAMRPETRMLFIETPTNPVMRLTDLAAASALAHGRGVKVIVDNTFASPCVQRPIEFGADLVVHSTTKYSTATATASAASSSACKTTTWRG